jgi:hypothetical protein
MPGARCARSRVCSVESTRVSHHGHTGNTRHSLRNGFNGFLRALPSDRAFLPLSPAEIIFRQLDASVGASGPHDFSVRVSTFRQARRSRPPHPVAYVRDDRETPLCLGRDGAGCAADLGVRSDWHDGQISAGRVKSENGESDCLHRQAILGSHGDLSRRIALRIVSSSRLRSWNSGPVPCRS